jgi:diguanylate cyclase (GGDEF)-like protein
MRYAEIRIDLVKNFPVTVYGEGFSSKKTMKFLLSDIVPAEDLPHLINQIDAIMAGTQAILQAHTRIKSEGEYSWFLLRCERKKEKFGKTHLSGFAFDVSSYLDYAGEDPVVQEVRRRNAERVNRISNRELTLTDVVDAEFLRKIQLPLIKEGLFSAIYDDDENLISSPDENADHHLLLPVPKELKYTKRVNIKISRVIAAHWTVAAASAELIERCAPLLDILVQAVSRTANSFAMLYNEMSNSEHSNKLLSEHIEQQILTNNLYNIILERKDSAEAITAVIRLVGEYMGMRWICVYDVLPQEQMIRRNYEWRSASCQESAEYEYLFPEISKIIERLEYTDMYIPPHNPDIIGSADIKPESCTVANLNGDGARFGVMVFAPLSPGYVPTAQESKVMRNVSQITAALILQRKTDVELEEINKRHRELAFIDPILNIPNRASLDNDFDGELERGKQGAVVALKITNLHTLNELFGHEYTDSMLRDVAKYIADISAPNLTVYRFSGNLLFFLLRGGDRESAKHTAEILIRRFDKPWKQANGEHYLDAAMGITLYPDGYNSRDSVYRAASLALFKASEYGVNSYAFFSENFKAEADTNYKYAFMLRDSINNGMKGFSLEFQPVVAIDDGEEYNSAEVFVRWANLPTVKLIRLAENIGLDIAIDSWVMKEACIFCKAMQEGLPDYSVSVNITPRVLRSGAVVPMVEEALRESGLNGQYLSIEFPEHSFSEKQESVLPTVKKLHKMGVKLVLDSFGADFGSLALLKHSYMDMIKVDYSLFTNVFGEFDEIWVNTVAQLASHLRSGICVKRVEDAGHLERAKHFGARYAQGWLFSKPMLEEEVLKKAHKAVKLK